MFPQQTTYQWKQIHFKLYEVIHDSSFCYFLFQIVYMSKSWVLSAVYEKTIMSMQ